MKSRKHTGKFLSVMIIVLAVTSVITLILIAAAIMLTRNAKSPLPPETAAEATVTHGEQLPTLPDPSENTPTEAENPQTYTKEEQAAYERVLGVIESGDSTGVAQMLLDGEIPQAVTDRLRAEDSLLLDYLLADALVIYSSRDDAEGFVRLRLAGYVSDACLYDYWEIVGAELPEEPLPDCPSGVDMLLVHELAQAYQRSDRVIRSLLLMRQTQLLDDSHHEALIRELGFDYTDEAYLRDNEIGKFLELSSEEMDAYDAVLKFADEGNCRSVAMLMVHREVTEPVFRKLYETDRDMMDCIIAQAMGGFSEENAYEYTVMLRQEGFVTDDCFRIYWQIMGTDAPEGEACDSELPGIDRFLLHELEEIYNRDREYGLEALRTIRNSGLMDDLTHTALIARLGFDYMQFDQKQ